MTPIPNSSQLSKTGAQSQSSYTLPPFHPLPYLSNGFWCIGHGSHYYEDGVAVQPEDPAITTYRAAALIVWRNSQVG